MKPIDEYVCVEEMEVRIIELARSESRTDADNEEIEELAQSILVIVLMQRGVDLETAFDMIGRDGVISVTVDPDGVLEITQDNERKS